LASAKYSGTGEGLVRLTMTYDHLSRLSRRLLANDI